MQCLPSENNHLSLEALLSILHNIKVSQVQVNVVALLALCRGHVPHHDKGPVLQDRTSRSHSRQGGVGEGYSVGGCLWQRGAADEREEVEELKGEREVRQQHGCSSRACPSWGETEKWAGKIYWWGTFLHWAKGCRYMKCNKHTNKKLNSHLLVVCALR